MYPCRGLWTATSCDGLALYSDRNSSPLSDRGSQFTKCNSAIEQQMCQNGDSSEHMAFKNLLLRLRDGMVKIEDWNL